MSDEIKIDKGIPAPANRSARIRWPWKLMEVGDSFLAEGKTMANFQPTAWRAGVIAGRKFACRPVEGGVRVWRIA